MMHTKQHFEGYRLHDETPNYGINRTAVPGGWLYQDRYTEAQPVFVPDPTAPHVRDDRRLKLREGWGVNFPRDGMIHYGPNDSGRYDFGINEDRVSRAFTAFHADDSETDHATRLEAHDALIASGSESPFVVVTGVVAKAKAKVEGGGV